MTFFCLTFCSIIASSCTNKRFLTYKVTEMCACDDLSSDVNFQVMKYDFDAKGCINFQGINFNDISRYADKMKILLIFTNCDISFKRWILFNFANSCRLLQFFLGSLFVKFIVDSSYLTMFLSEFKKKSWSSIFSNTVDNILNTMEEVEFVMFWMISSQHLQCRSS